MQNRFQRINRKDVLNGAVKNFLELVFNDITGRPATGFVLQKLIKETRESLDFAILIFQDLLVSALHVDL